MVAERDNQRVTKERTSALILLANARVWASEGWQVSITDADGKELDSAGFENWLGPLEASPLQPLHVAPLEAPHEQDLSAEAELAADDAEAREPHQARASEEVESEDFESEEAEGERAEAEDYEAEDYYEDLDAPERELEDHDFSEASGSLT
jgi:hypothetical protein